MQNIKPRNPETEVISTEATIEKLFAKADKIETWLKAHWNETGPHVRKKRRCLLVILEEINLLLDMQKVTT